MEPSPVRLVSPSRISTFIDCPKKYNYIYELNLQPTGQSKGYFNKGNYFHELSHAYYQLIQAGAVPGSDYALASIIRRIRNDIEKTRDPELISVYSTITKAITRFIKEQSPKIDQGITVLHTEGELLYPLPDLRTALFGYADLIYRNKSGRIVVRDHKTGDKAWSKVDAQFSLQLMYYAAIVWKLYDEIPHTEISYTNTREYLQKQASYENAFTYTQVSYSERELEIFLEEIQQVIARMISFEPFPQYGQHCRYCPFQMPCFLSRRGMDAGPILAQNYVKRADTRSHGSFTEEHAKDDQAD